MFAVIEHPVTITSAGQVHAWPPRVAGPTFATMAEADAAAWASRARDPDGSYEVVELTGHEAGVAIVRPVVRVLGGYGRGDSYEAEYWG